MARRALKLETRYAHLRRDAKVMTVMLEQVSAILSQAARGIDVGSVPKPSDLREWSSECQRIANQCGRQYNGRSAR